jgi:PAS domain S-box-containing protein
MNDDRISDNWLFERTGQTAAHGKVGDRNAIAVDEGVGIVDDAGKLVYASPVFARLHGYEPGEMTGLGLNRIFQPCDSVDIAPLLKGVREDSFASFKATHLRRDESSFPASVNLIKMPGEGKWCGYYVCIVRAEAEGLDSTDPEALEPAGGEASFEGLIQRSLTGIYRTTLEGEILLANPQFAKIFGYESPSELLRVNARDLYPDESARKDFVRLITRLDRLENYRDIGRCKDGKTIKTLENARLVRDEEHKPLHIEGTLIDITDLVEAEERNSIYVRALEEAHGAILIATPEGNIQYANSAASKFYGYLSEHLVGMNFRDLVSGPQHQDADHFLEVLLQKGHWVGEFSQSDSNGRERIASLAMSVVPDDEGHSHVLIVSAKDISELRILESQLLQAQKMEAIGLLASGVAHNVNSPLSAIIMTAEMAQISHPEVEEFGDILQAAARIGEIISNLTKKSRLEQSGDAMEVDVNQMVKTELKFLEANLFFKHNVELTLNLEPGLPRIHGLYSDFSQCCQNLFQNALDALESAAECRLHVLTRFKREKNQIELCIRDSGCGIPSAQINRIFEPFYTTKAESDMVDPRKPSGTGLGLSTTRQLLSKYDASITVESRSGEGTEFCIHFPVPGETV